MSDALLFAEMFFGAMGVLLALDRFLDIWTSKQKEQ